MERRNNRRQIRAGVEMVRSRREKETENGKKKKKNRRQIRAEVETARSRRGSDRNL